MVKMEFSVPAFRLFSFLFLFGLAWSQSIVEYVITEEEIPTVVLGNIVENSELRNLNSTLLQDASYEIVELDNDQHEYFSMSGEELLYTTQLDRDEICPRAVECKIHLDIQVQTNTAFYLIKVSITILDINDRIPTFREDAFEFSLSEASALGLLLPLPTATDFDSPHNGIVEYTVENLPGVFTFQSGGIDSALEPAIVLIEGLDREEVDWYTFDLLASDSASLPNTGSTRISIQVLDVNDNAPEFSQTSYEVEVSESIRPGDEIIRITATDIDDGDNAQIVYQLSGQTVNTYGDLFIVNENTGQILLNGELDFETITEASLTIIARNQDASSLYSQARVQITVLDVNDNAPSIRIINEEDGKMSVSEYTSPAVVISLVKVTDGDTGDGGLFDCSLDSSEFELIKYGDDTDYTLSTLTELDRETIASYELSIKCTDNGIPPMSSESVVMVNIADENDNKPSFEKNLFIFNVSENVLPGDEIFTITATDADAGDNARMSYTLGDISMSFAIGAYFEIDTDTGIVSTKHALDYENTTQYKFLIIATDNGNPSLSTACNVSLHILDEDDNVPMFALQGFSIDIEEGNDAGAEVTQVTANDADSPPFNAITYELVNNDELESNFSIDPNTGAIFANSNLDREEEMNFWLTVKAVGPPPLSHNSTATVFVNVLDVNDNDPVISFPTDDNDTITVSSYLRKHSIIGHIIADDSDENENAQLSYHIVSGDIEGIFELDDTSGYLSMKDDYKVTHVHTMELLILVSDNGTPKLTTSARLYIAFNETMVDADESSLENKGKNESIAIIIGVLSGVLVVILLVAIICVFRRLNNHKQAPKATRLQSPNESVLEHDTSSSVPYGEFPGDGSYGDQAVRGYDNSGMDQSEGDTSKTPVHYSGDGYNPAVGQGVKDSGSEGSNADSGHGSHEDTSSIPGAGSLQKWDAVFLPPGGSTHDGDPNGFVNEIEMLPEDRQYPEFTHPPPYRPHGENMSHVFSLPENNQHMTSQQPTWLPLEDCNTNQDLSYQIDHNNPYGYRDSPDLYKHLDDTNMETSRGPVIDLREYGHHNNEYAVDEVDQFNCDYRMESQIPRHLKRRSNSFANDYFPSREYDVYPGHIAGFCTPQPKNIKYCSQV